SRLASRAVMPIECTVTVICRRVVLTRLRGLAGFEDTRLLQINGLGQKVFTTAVGLGDGCRGDPGRRLRWEAELEAVDEELQLGFGMSVAGEQYLASVGGWQMNVDHLDGSELFERATRGQPRRQRMKATGQSDLHAVSQEGDEDVGLDPLLVLMEDRTDR